ncbi:MAG: sugar ABC transporter substrate-binding protein [Acetobacteraceae bacterium]|nr:sugar ABC transporter substrate-binding protein [Acetobacteraceae bacterium]
MTRTTRRGVLAGAGATLLAAPALAQRQVTLRIAYPAWDSTDQQQAVTAIFAEYERQNPGTRIEILSLPFPVLRQRLVVAARAGDPPDIAYCDGRWVPEMAVPGLLADLTQAAAQLDRADWHAEPWRGSTVRGRIFGIPDRIDPWLVYCNAEHFERAGITSFPTTMDGLAETAKKLTGNGIHGWGLIGAKDASLISRYINFLYAHHGDLLTPDGQRSAFAQPEGVAALRFYTDLLVKYQAAQPSAIANGLNDVNQLFQAGRVSMIIDGPWRMGALRDQAPNLRWSLAQLPPAAGKSPRFLTSSWYYTVFRGGRQQPDAVRFVEFLLRPENMARSVVTLPARKSAARAPRFAAPIYAPWLAAVPYTVPFTPTDKFTEIADVVGDAVQQVLAGRSTADAAAAEASRRIDALVG